MNLPSSVARDLEIKVDHLGSFLQVDPQQKEQIKRSVWAIEPNQGAPANFCSLTAPSEDGESFGFAIIFRRLGMATQPIPVTHLVGSQQSSWFFYWVGNPLVADTPT